MFIIKFNFIKSLIKILIVLLIVGIRIVLLLIVAVGLIVVMIVSGIRIIIVVPVAPIRLLVWGFSTLCAMRTIWSGFNSSLASIWFTFFLIFGAIFLI